MADSLSAPVLEATLARLAGRERRRGRDAATRRALVAVAIAVLLVCAARVFDLVMGRPPLPVTAALALVTLVALVGAAFVIRGAAGRSEAEMSRDLDRRLGLDDRMSSALCLLRGTPTSQLSAYVVSDAESVLARAAPRVDAAFPVKPERRVTWLVRWLFMAAAVAIVLTIIAQLLTLNGPLRILPGISIGGGDPQPLVPPTKDAPRRSESKPAPASSQTPQPDAGEAKRSPPKRDSAKAEVKASIKMSKDEFDSAEPVNAAVTAAATGELAGAKTFDLRVSVDGVECDTGSELTVDPAIPQGDRVEVDLKLVPGLKLTPGEHVATARLTDRTTHEEHTSAPVKFRIAPPPDDKNDAENKDKGAAPPPPKPKPEPEARAGAPKPNDVEPSPPGAPPPPPPATQKHVVVPLFGDGETVKKKGLVLVLDPSGGNETPPERRAVGDALPAAKRRAEEAVDRAKLSDADRDLVRRYFDLLGELRR